MPASETTEGSISDNLPSNAKPLKNKVFDTTDDKSFNYTSQLQAYDSLGNLHIIKVFYVKGDNAGEWTVHCFDETAPVKENDKNKSFTADIKFDEYGKVKEIKKFRVQGESLNGANALSIAIDLAAMTQQGDEKPSGKTSTNGYGVGKFNGYSVGDNGEVIANYSNQQTQLIAQVVMASFTKTGGLQPTGDNCWTETGASGAPLIGTSGTGSFGAIRGKMLEASNVDMSNELVKMMTQQRNYQSNAQTIKTQDQLLQTLVSMR
ncbi:Flagellar hook protein FlgE [Sodalis praecaptivus]